MTHPERGQKVRATWTTVVEGILDGVDNKDNLQIRCSDKSHRWAPPSAHVEILLHDEPGLGSIVIDKNDRAWQHQVGGWACVNARLLISWAQLNEQFGPINFLWSR